MFVLVVFGCVRVGVWLCVELLALRWYFWHYLGLRAYEVSVGTPGTALHFVFRRMACFFRGEQGPGKGGFLRGGLRLPGSSAPCVIYREFVRCAQFLGRSQSLAPNRPITQKDASPTRAYPYPSGALTQANRRPGNADVSGRRGGDAATPAWPGKGLGYSRRKFITIASVIQQ